MTVLRMLRDETWQDSALIPYSYLIKPRLSFPVGVVMPANYTQNNITLFYLTPLMTGDVISYCLFANI